MEHQWPGGDDLRVAVMPLEERTYAATCASARVHARAGYLAQWLQTFLRNEGGNVPFAEGLLLAPRRYHAPARMKLEGLTRCCGPEPYMAFRVERPAFERRVAGLMDALREGSWDVPPLIVQRSGETLTLSDGNHRLEALRRLGATEAWVIVWETLSDKPEEVY